MLSKAKHLYLPLNDYLCRSGRDAALYLCELCGKATHVHNYLLTHYLSQQC